jgi:hypothetical protein
MISFITIENWNIIYVGVFHIDKIHGGQDRALQFWGGLVNNEIHGDLSWFRPLLKVMPYIQWFGIEDEQVLQGVSREREKFVW